MLVYARIYSMRGGGLETDLALGFAHAVLVSQHATVLKLYFLYTHVAVFYVLLKPQQDEIHQFSLGTYRFLNFIDPLFMFQ